MKHPSRLTNWILAALLLVSGAVLGSLAVSGRQPALSETLPVQAAGPAAPAFDLQSAQKGYSTILAKATPAVVNISTTRAVKVQIEGMWPDDPLFRRFFGDRFPRGENAPSQRETGLGSGVIVDPAGYIVTNDHVVDSATDIHVVLNDQQDFKARVVGTDAKTDLALLKIDAEGLPYLPLADSTKAAVGDIVFAIGNPFGVGQTVTMGIVSALGRGNLGIEDYEDFIQTDASINPGNSGGALIDTQGQLVGINTAIIGRSGGSDGVGFAIPSAMVRSIVGQLRENGQVARGLLGAVIQNVTPNLAKAFGLDEAKGALVSDLTPDGPAVSSGLKRGDVVVEFNGRAVPDSRRLRLWVAETPPGTLVRLGVMREGKAMELSVKLSQLKDGPENQVAEESHAAGDLRGLEVQDLNAELRAALSLPSEVSGVVVTGVEAGSVGFDAGLLRGDVVQEVDRRPVADASAFREAIRKAGSNAALLLVYRRGATLFVVLPAK